MQGQTTATTATNYKMCFIINQGQTNAYLKEAKELQPFASKLRPFHFTIVDGKNECLNWLERAWGTTS